MFDALMFVTVTTDASIVPAVILFADISPIENVPASRSIFQSPFEMLPVSFETAIEFAAMRFAESVPVVILEALRFSTVTSEASSVPVVMKSATIAPSIVMAVVYGPL